MLLTAPRECLRLLLFGNGFHGLLFEPNTAACTSCAPVRSGTTRIQAVLSGVVEATDESAEMADMSLKTPHLVLLSGGGGI